MPSPDAPIRPHSGSATRPIALQQTIRRNCRALVGPALLALAWLAHAGTTDSPVGLWKTIDDNDGKPRGLIRVTESGGELRGTIEKGLRPEDREDDICTKCPGDLHGRKIVGLTILTGMKKEGDHWGGGQIVDPKSGSTYRCKMTLVEGGTRLDVRGYIGVSLFGRTQTWQRVE